LAPWIRPTFALVMALGLGVADAFAAIPTNPGALPTEITQAKWLLEANGYTDIAVLSSDDQIVTASAMKDEKKSRVDVDPITGIILPHIDLPPIPAQVAPVADLAQTRAGGRR
jgi:hypothetical protein